MFNNRVRLSFIITEQFLMGTLPNEGGRNSSDLVYREVQWSIDIDWLYNEDQLSTM